MGFKKKRKTLDAVYVMNYPVNRQVSRKKGAFVALIVDLKAVFDLGERETVIRAMRRREIKEELIVTLGEVLSEARSRERIGKEIGEDFLTARGVRQGCPLSPMLFNLVLADLKEEMERAR